MKHFAFNTVVENQIETCKDMLIRKSDEYSGASDRLHNFRVAASLKGVTQKQALAGMMAKHTVSVYDMIRDDEEYSAEQWSEKITDHINYLLLLRAMVEDELATKQLVDSQE